MDIPVSGNSAAGDVAGGISWHGLTVEDTRRRLAAIARMLGIGDGTTAISGAEIDAMDTATLQERVQLVDVFARASPEHSRHPAHRQG